jgi:hypothetical protein
MNKADTIRRDDNITINRSLHLRYYQNEPNCIVLEANSVSNFPK